MKTKTEKIGGFTFKRIAFGVASRLSVTHKRILDSLLAKRTTRIYETENAKGKRVREFSVRDGGTVTEASFIVG